MGKQVSQEKYDEMCNQMREAFNYSSMTPEQQASFDSQLSDVMASKGVSVDPGLSSGSGNGSAADEGHGEQNRDEINDGIPSYETESENENESEGPSQDDDLEL